jgi:hypothetical protein
MASLTLTVFSFGTQHYTGHLIDSLIATVERAEKTNANPPENEDELDLELERRRRAGSLLTIEEVLDRVTGGKITQHGFDFGAPEDLGAKIEAQRRADRRAS